MQRRARGLGDGARRPTRRHLPRDRAACRDDRRPRMTDDEINLRVPGPTPLPPEVREALARPMMNHRSPAFEAILREVHANLQYFFATENPVLTFPASGTGGLEASIVNLLSP